MKQFIILSFFFWILHRIVFGIKNTHEREQGRPVNIDELGGRLGRQNRGKYQVKKI